MPTEMELMSLLREGTVSAIPPTADVTETAGVSIPSAKVSDVPKRLYFDRYELAWIKKSLNRNTNPRKEHPSKFAEESIDGASARRG
jgi:hypothetical protein